MAPARVTQEQIDYYGRIVCMPLTLLINFSLFQYLIMIYYRRRREPHCIVLFASGFVAFASLIPFAHDDDVVVNDLNDISEVLSVTTFLIQITMLGRDVNKKLRIRSFRYMTHASEMLIAFALAVAAKDVVVLALPHSTALAKTKVIGNIVEEVALWFIFVFRFYFIAMSKGVKALLAAKKREIVLYLLFVTHEYPFAVLNAQTDLDWEEVQALWHRVTMALCLFNTVKEKLRSATSRISTRGANLHHSATEPSRKSYVPKHSDAIDVRTPSIAQLTKRVVTFGPSLGAIVPSNV